MQAISSAWGSASGGRTRLKHSVESVKRNLRLVGRIAVDKGRFDAKADLSRLQPIRRKPRHWYGKMNVANIGLFRVVGIAQPHVML
jgi:hypothetical protein